MQTSGTDLKVERVRARVRMGDLAARMGISRATLWIIERSEVVSPERVQQYREALSGGREVTTGGTAA